MYHAVFARIARFVRYGERHDGYWILYDNKRCRGAILCSKEDWLANKNKIRTEQVNIAFEKGSDDEET